MSNWTSDLSFVSPILSPLHIATVKPSKTMPPLYSWWMYSYLTFRGPCIVIYSYNKTNDMHLISQIYFWNRTLHVLDRFFVHYQECSTVYTAIGICHTGFADCLLAGSGS